MLRTTLLQTFDVPVVMLTWPFCAAPLSQDEVHRHNPRGGAEQARSDHDRRVQLVLPHALPPPPQVARIPAHDAQLSGPARTVSWRHGAQLALVQIATAAGISLY